MLFAWKGGADQAHSVWLDRHVNVGNRNEAATRPEKKK